jgi:hypothetical protein
MVYNRPSTDYAFHICSYVRPHILITTSEVYATKFTYSHWLKKNKQALYTQYKKITINDKYCKVLKNLVRQIILLTLQNTSKEINQHKITFEYITELG